MQTLRHRDTVVHASAVSIVRHHLVQQLRHSHKVLMPGPSQYMGRHGLMETLRHSHKIVHATPVFRKILVNANTNPQPHHIGWILLFVGRHQLCKHSDIATKQSVPIVVYKNHQLTTHQRMSSPRVIQMLMHSHTVCLTILYKQTLVDANTKLQPRRGACLLHFIERHQLVQTQRLNHTVAHAYCTFQKTLPDANTKRYPHIRACIVRLVKANTKTCLCTY